MKKLKEKEAKEIIEQRENIIKYLSKRRISFKKAKKMIFDKFKNDGPIHKIFLSRPDLKKDIGISYCLKTMNPNNWFILFDNKNLNFTVPEILFWAIKADKYTNPYYHEDKTGNLINYSILSHMMKREEVKDFFNKTSVINLLIIALKLDNNQEVLAKIGEKEGYSVFKTIFNKDIIFPKNVLNFIKVVITAIPVSFLSFVYSSKVDEYLEKKFKNAKNKPF